MRMLAMTAGTMFITSLLATGCVESEETVEDEVGAAAPAQSEDRAAASLPDTTAEAVWAYLRQQDYRASWRLWPGKDRLYEGTEPHGMLLTTYANDVAQRALANGDVANLPPGSILVKENYMPDSTFDAATVMYRVAGYNPEHEDWLFAKYDAEGAADAFGRAPMCQACHEQAEAGYVYTEVTR